MRAVQKFFLRARHWQLFLLFGCLYLLGIVLTFAGDLGASPKSSSVSASLIVGEILIFFCMLCLLGWMGSIGLFLNTLKEPSARSRTRFFWFALIYSSLYLLVFIGYFFNSGSAVPAWAIVPPHLFAMFCIFYAAYFASKSLVMVERSGPVVFYDYAGPFFLIWFFPVGVWFIQPRINRLYAQSSG